jgi:hypothetical protein
MSLLVLNITDSGLMLTDIRKTLEKTSEWRKNV